MQRPERSTYVAIALIAGGVMLFELALMRIFSFSIWHHFAFMVISVALLGFAFSGVALEQWPRLARPPRAAAGRAAALAGIGFVAAVAALAHLPFDPTRFGQEPRQLLTLTLYYLVLLLPFSLAGFAIVSLLAGFGAAVDRLYASDLVGAGLGTLALVVFARPLGAEGVVVLAAALLSAAAVLLGAGWRRRVAPLLLCLLWSVLVPRAATVLSIPPGPGKGLGVVFEPGRNLPDARILFAGWNAISRVDVVGGAGVASWTVNPHSAVRPPPQTLLFIDGDAVTPIVDAAGDLRFLDATLSSAAMQALAPERVLVIGAGGGVDVLTALHHGAREIDAVEVNPLVAELVTDRFAERGGGLFARPEIRLHLDEGRSFVRRSDERWDLVQISLIDTWAASAAGAYSLAEGYLYTVEAFVDFLGHLDDDGALTVTRWLWMPPRETMKLCSVAAEALRRLGAERPGEHVMVLQLGRLANVVIKRQPFTTDERVAIERVAAERGFTVLYRSDGPAVEPFATLLSAEDPEPFYDDYLYDVRPSVDDRPFFFQFGRWRDARLLGGDWSDSPSMLSGRLVVVAILIQALVLSLALLVLPMLRLERRAEDAEAGDQTFGRVLVYFLAIGLGFMLLEMSLIQRFTLYLGHPIYAVSVVLAVLLLTAGIGSAWAGRLGGQRPGRVFAGLLVLVVLQATAVPAVFRLTLGWETGWRVLVSILLLAPVGTLLGMPFPLGIARLTGGGRALVGWGWAANGVGSVLGPLLAVLLAFDLGFTAVMVLAGVLYAGAWWTSASVPKGLES